MFIWSYFPIPNSEFETKFATKQPWRQPDNCWTCWAPSAPSTEPWWQPETVFPCWTPHQNWTWNAHCAPVRRFSWPGAAWTLSGSWNWLPSTAWASWANLSSGTCRPNPTPTCCSSTTTCWQATSSWTNKIRTFWPLSQFLPTTLFIDFYVFYLSDKIIFFMFHTWSISTECFHQNSIHEKLVFPQSILCKAQIGIRYLT